MITTTQELIEEILKASEGDLTREIVITTLFGLGTDEEQEVQLEIIEVVLGDKSGHLEIFA